ncbi:MAG: DUF2062 domain-containing protein [Porticoccaceae bacterium]|nr:DUF2062 domain-containing protein [Porticoccaceae bacterium]
MPRKLFRRLIPVQLNPKPNSLASRWFGPILNDPHLLHLNRHSVSIAFFIGLFCAFLPIPGQTFVVTALALVLRCNLPISVVLIWVSNPLTIPPMILGLHQLGQWMLGHDGAAATIQFNWQWISENFDNVYLPMLLAGVICGLIIGGIGYFAVRILWRWKVIKSWEARKQKRLQRPS